MSATDSNRQSALTSVLDKYSLSDHKILITLATHSLEPTDAMHDIYNFIVL